MSGVPIIYRKGGIIFKIKIFNIYQEKKARVMRQAPEKQQPLILPTHKPRVSVLTEQSVTIFKKKKEEKKSQTCTTLLKNGRTLISNK